jgi:hypothetical protein
VSVQASFAIPSLREVATNSLIIASFSGADCFWMPLHAVYRLRVIRPRYGVLLDKFLMSATLQRKPSVMGIAVRFVTFFLPFLPLETLCVCNYNLQFGFT